MRSIIFVGNARDYHAIDWFHTIKKICTDRKVLFATDLIESEGHDKIVSSDDSDIIKLFIVDKYLFPKQTLFGNFWRNLVKILFLKIQIEQLKNISLNNPNAIFHAHTMYYMLMCYYARVEYIGTPQGSEISRRPFNSQIYRYFAKKAMKNAKIVFVDSFGLQKLSVQLFNVKPEIVQYGIDVDSILSICAKPVLRDKIVSIRGFYSLYRINEIIKARKIGIPDQNIYFFYPYWEEKYKSQILKSLEVSDVHLGRLQNKNAVYCLLRETNLAISIPEIDSSPRSVYESIFCGCCVVITYNSWYDIVPECMKKRIIIVDIENEFWLRDALGLAKTITADPYVPSEEALNMFDQVRSMKRVADNYYK